MPSNNKKSLSRKIKALIYKTKRKRINQNLLIYLVMVLIATASWIINKCGSTVSGIATFRIEYYGLPQNRILVPGITTNQLRISFQTRGMELLSHHGDYSPIRIDLSKLDIRTVPESDTTLKFITDDDIRSQVESQLPNEYKFMSLKPDTIKLDFGSSSHKKVPVVLNQEITYNQQYRPAGSPVLQPDSVVITGSSNIVDTIYCITTELLKLSKISETIETKVKLDIPAGIFCQLKTTDISINVEKYTENTISVPIRQINVPDTVSLRIFSQNATIKYNVGWTNYKKISKEMFTVVADYNDLTGIVRPKYIPLKITKKPEGQGVTNIAITPEAVEYLIERKE